MAIALLDTNVFLRHLQQDHPVYSPQATALLERIERGELEVRITDLIVFETVFSLQRSYKQPKADITKALLPLLELPGIVLPGKRIYREVFSLYVSSPLGFADCYHAALMQQLGISDVFSFDTDFDHIPGFIRRQS